MTVATSFPFSVGPSGQVRVAEGADALRGRVLQVLFTSPGERVALPEFGCGLLDLVFEPSDELLIATVRFSIAQGLTRWLGDEIVVDGVDLSRADGVVTVEVAYTRRIDQRQEGVRARFADGSPWRTG